MGINGKLPATVKFQVVDLGLGRVAFKTTEWRGDPLGGVTVIKGEFVNGKPMAAVPNYVPPQSRRPLHESGLKWMFRKPKPTLQNS